MRKLLSLMCLGALALAACAGGQPNSTAEDTGALAAVPSAYAGLTNPLGADSAQEGAQVFESNCAMCHGSAGHGDGTAGQSLDPRPGNLAEIQAQAGDDYLFWRIHDGKPGTAMVAWQGILSDEQIWQTVSFLRTLR
jgi:mono/diheme cytochrome c family protein